MGISQFWLGEFSGQVKHHEGAPIPKDLAHVCHLQE